MLRFGAGRLRLTAFISISITQDGVEVGSSMSWTYKNTRLILEGDTCMSLTFYMLLLGKVCMYAVRLSGLLRQCKCTKDIQPPPRPSRAQYDKRNVRIQTLISQS